MTKPKMYLWLIQQEENDGCETYNAAIVAAETADAARNIIPTYLGGPRKTWPSPYRDWASCPENVTVKMIGIADEEIEPGCILGSCNAG